MKIGSVIQRMCVYMILAVLGLSACGSSSSREASLPGSTLFASSEDDGDEASSDKLPFDVFSEDSSDGSSDDMPFSSLLDESAGSYETVLASAEISRVSISKNQWVPAYMDAMYEIERSYHSATLIYLNDDDIPEILCFSPSQTAGGHIYSFQMDALGGRIIERSLNCGSSVFYTPRGGYLSYHNCDTQYNYDEMFLLTNGKFEKLFSGAVFNGSKSQVYAISGTASNENEYYRKMDDIEQKYPLTVYCDSQDYHSKDDVRNALESFSDNLTCEYLPDKDGYVAQAELSFNTSTNIDDYWIGNDTIDLEGYFKALGGNFYAPKDDGQIMYYVGVLGDWNLTIIAKDYFDSYIVQVRFEGASRSYMLDRMAFKNNYKLVDNTAIKVKGYDATINKESINFLPIIVECVTNCTGEDPYEGVYPELLRATDEDEFYYQSV